MMKKLVILAQGILFVVLGLGIGFAPVAHAVTESELQTAASQATQYLADQQQSDGSIAGFGGETDWSVIAVAATGIDPATVQTPDGTSLTDALIASPLDSSDSATSVERRILAVAALGEDTTSYGGVNYDTLLANQVHAGQVGDPTLLNDDMFAVMAVDASDDAGLLPVAQQALGYVLANQDASGGFSWATPDNAWYSGPDSNNTAAAIVAMQSAQDLGLAAPTLQSSLASATTYLLDLQDVSGGFLYDGNSWTTAPDTGSTAWAIIALNTFGDQYIDKIQSAQSWLLQKQSEDGGFGYDPGFSDTMTTPHAILALLGKTWVADPSAVASDFSGQASGQSTDGVVASATTGIPITATASSSSSGRATNLLPVAAAVALVKAAHQNNAAPKSVQTAGAATTTPVAQSSHLLRMIGVGIVLVSGLGLAGALLLPKFKH